MTANIHDHRDEPGYFSGRHDHPSAGAHRHEDEDPPRTRPLRCPICGGLNPGDVTHTRCM